MAIIYSTATSLDGFIIDEHDSLAWLFATPDHNDDPGGRHGDAATLQFDTFVEGVGAVVLGANSYDWIVREFEASGEPFEWPYHQPSWVVTHRDLDLPPGVRRHSGPVAHLHPELVAAAADRDVWILGGGDLAGQFADAGLLDRVLLHVCPVTLGAGRPLLPRRLRLHRRRVERDGQFTAMLFDVVGPEPTPEPRRASGLLGALNDAQSARG
jgi:dihydrofolate reductase